MAPQPSNLASDASCAAPSKWRGCAVSLLLACQLHMLSPADGTVPDGFRPAGPIGDPQRMLASQRETGKEETEGERGKERRETHTEAPVRRDRGHFLQGRRASWALPVLDNLDTSSELRMPPCGDSRGDSAFSSCSGSMGAIADFAQETRILVYQLVFCNIVRILLYFYGVFMNTRSV